MKGEYGLLRIFRSSVAYSLSDVILKLIGFFLVPLYTRAMAPDQYGITGYLTALSQVVIPLMGLGVINCLPMLYFSYEEQERACLVSTAFNAVALFGLLVAGGLTLAGPGLFGLISGDVPFSPYILVALWASPFICLNFLPLGLFNIRGRPVPYMAFSVGLALVNVAATVVFVVLERMGALGVQYALLVSSLLGTGVTAWVIRREYRAVINCKMLRALLVLALPVLPHLVSGTVSRFADRFFLASLSTMATTGMYSLALVLASPVLVVMGGVFSALNPVFYKRAAAQDPALLEDWGVYSALYLLIGVMATLALSLFARELLMVVAPASYGDAHEILPILAVSQLMLGIYWIFSPSIGHVKKMWVYPFASFLGITVGIACNLLLIPRLGATGAALSSVASAFTQMTAFFFWSQRFYPVRYRLWQILPVLGLPPVVFILYQIMVEGRVGLIAGISLKLLVLLVAGAGLLALCLPPALRAEIMARLPGRRG